MQPKDMNRDDLLCCLTSVSASRLICFGISFHPESVLVVPFSARAPSRAAEAPAEARALSGKSLNAEEIQHKVEQKRRTPVHVHACLLTGAKPVNEETEREKITRI